MGVPCFVPWLFKHPPRGNGGLGGASMVFETIIPHKGVGLMGFYVLFHGYFNIPQEVRTDFVGWHGFRNNNPPREEGFGGGSMCCSNVIKTNPRGKGFRWGRHGFQNNNSPWRGGL